MIPFLSLHANAAQRGDGLHPMLLAGLQRLAMERVEYTAAETDREQGARIAEPTADNATRKGNREVAARGTTGHASQMP